MTATRYDAEALPLLLDVMRAAGAHDLDAVQARTQAALTIIARQGHHKARPDILAARSAAESGEWVACWGRAYHAICGLTHVFPPDPAACPPRPDDAAPAPIGATQCQCGTEVPAGHRFCHRCGSATQ